MGRRGTGAISKSVGRGGQAPDDTDIDGDTGRGEFVWWGECDAYLFAVQRLPCVQHSVK